MIEWIYDMDKNILLLIQDYVRDDMLTPVMKFITTLGNAGFIWIVLAILLCIIKKYRRTGITCFYALGLSLVINNLFLKHFIARSRPFDVIGELVPLIPKPTDFSFPSGTYSVLLCSRIPAVSETSEEVWHTCPAAGSADQFFEIIRRRSLSERCDRGDGFRNLYQLLSGDSCKFSGEMCGRTS